MSRPNQLDKQTAGGPAGFVYFEDQLNSRDSEQRRLYKQPAEIITAHTAEEFLPSLNRLEELRGQGFYLAGYFSYEAGYLLEPALSHRLSKNHGPLLQFGAFKEFSREHLPSSEAILSAAGPAWSETQYGSAFKKVARYIKAGDVYQINLTFPMTGNFTGNAAGVYQTLKQKQPVEYGGIISLGGQDIVTISPELFFTKTGTMMNMRPMKGTISRGSTPDEDERHAAFLKADPKNQAENLMIVDLLRNDLSRLCIPGSVKVDDLFKIETYPSLHTMTSGISATLAQDTSLASLLTALFPCGSVTGAPKIRAMEIINELEKGPRNAYCGAIGLIDPDGHMRFNVGIRTLTLEGGTYSYPVGSGVVYDSNAKDEYEECLLKAKVLKQDNFGLIETLGWHEQTGFMHMDLHINRLATSAEALGFHLDIAAVLRALNKAAKPLTGPQKIRLVLSKYGQLETSASPLKISVPTANWPISISDRHLDSEALLIRHKTTRRSLYKNELAKWTAATGCKEVIFFNEKGELCEGSYTNIYVSIDGTLFTPPITSGLLPGIGRQVMIANGDAHERVLYLEDLQNAEAVFVGNSARGLIRAALV